jgi:hypothetical protein
MRFTWGHAAIVIPVIIAVVFTSVLIKAMSLKGRAELVVDNYYAKEIAYQENIDATDNAGQINLDLTLITTPNLAIGLSADKALTGAEGTVKLFRPSNKALDFDIPLQLDANNQMALPLEKVITGAYQIQIWLTIDDTPYYIEENVFMP